MRGRRVRSGSHPILWRLVCRHVLCRHTNTGRYRYRGAAETFEAEWRGESHAADFTVFGPGCSYTYSDNTRVLGGHGLLIVAVKLDDAMLCDYVHVRITGTNPTRGTSSIIWMRIWPTTTKTSCTWFVRSSSTNQRSGNLRGRHSARQP